jgi:hypothetical protein
LACINVKQTSAALDGEMNVVSNVDSELRQVMSTDPKDISVRTKFAISPNIPLTKEAQAVEMVLKGDPRAALAVLRKMEEEDPGDYSTAANIGTVYELIGDNVNALKWIKEGIIRNSASHFHTEWLHALILEAKVDAMIHPEAPLQNRLLMIPERISDDTEIAVQGAKYSASNVRKALYHQLTERLLFVKPKDPYVADLLYSYAIVEANLGTIHSGLALLQMAREYGFSDEALLREHEKRYRSFTAMLPIKEKVTVYAFIILSAVLVVYVCRKLWSLCRS